MNKTLCSMLIDGARELGIALAEEQVRSFELFSAELQKWNSKINLTAIRDERDIVIKHYLDSLAYLQALSGRPGMMIMDLGSGAGFPGIPMKIVRQDLNITMVESVKKKASFLRHSIRTLGLKEISVLDQHTGTLPATYSSRFDIITARAFADMPSAIDAGLPFLKPGGCFVFSRGPEERIGDPDLAKRNVSVDRTIAVTLPFSDNKRMIWVLCRKPLG